MLYYYRHSTTKYRNTLKSYLAPTVVNIFAALNKITFLNNMKQWEDQIWKVLLHFIFVMYSGFVESVAFPLFRETIPAPALHINSTYIKCSKINLF